MRNKNQKRGEWANGFKKVQSLRCMLLDYVAANSIPSGPPDEAGVRPQDSAGTPEKNEKEKTEETRAKGRQSGGKTEVGGELKGKKTETKQGKRKGTERKKTERKQGKR